MFDNLVSFFLITICGVFFKWKRLGNIDSKTTRHIINILVIHFFLPALCFKVAATATLNKNTILLPISAFITISFSILISFLVYTIVEKFITIHKEEKGALILGASFGNVTFLGLLFLTDLYGHEVSQYVLLYDLMATSPLFWTIGTAVASYYGNSQKLTVREGINTIVNLPPIWALVIGFTINFLGIHLPNFLLKTLELMSTPIVPLMGFSTGLAFSRPKLKHAIIAIPAVAIKLCLIPVFAFGTALFLGMNGLALKSSVMEAAMPTMILTLILSSQYKLDYPLSTLIIVLTTTAAFITLPLTSWFLMKF